MITVPRREIFLCEKEVFITFDANNKEEDEFTLSFSSEEEAYNFTKALEAIFKELDENCHHNTTVGIYTDQLKGCGSLEIGKAKYYFSCANVEKFHENFSKNLWGDTAD